MVVKRVLSIGTMPSTYTGTKNSRVVRENMKTDGGAILPASHNSLILGSLLSNADLLEVTVTKVLQQPLDVLLRCAKFGFSGRNSVISSVQNVVL